MAAILDIGVAILGVIIGLLVGIGIKYKTSGIFVIDKSDPKTDKYGIEITEPLDDIPKRNYILLKVVLRETEIIDVKNELFRK